MHSLNFLLTRLSRISFLGMMLLTIVMLSGAKPPVNSNFVGQQIHKENSKQVNPFANFSFEENEELESQDDFEGQSFVFLKNNPIEFSAIRGTRFLAVKQQPLFIGQRANPLYIRLRKLLI